MGLIDADRSFVRDLKQIDKRLGCVFSDKIQRFVVTFEKVIGPPQEVFVVERENGEYRPPDRRDLVRLHHADLHRKTAKERERETAEYFKEYRDKEEKDRKDNIRNMTKDNKLQLQRAVGQLDSANGKFNSTFRRITPKPKGEVFSK